MVKLDSVLVSPLPHLLALESTTLGQLDHDVAEGERRTGVLQDGDDSATLRGGSVQSDKTRSAG